MIRLLWNSRRSQMTYKAPTPAELRNLAHSLNRNLDNENLDRIYQYMQLFSQTYEYIDSQANEYPGLIYPERNFTFPGVSDNEYGAWYVKTSIPGADNGPLTGRKVVVKDNILVAGIPLSIGSSLLRDCIPDFDATVVTRLLDAGAEIVGKSVCENLCMSGSSFTAHTGVVHNPRKAGYSSGGSSSGSTALVAAGEVDMALGTDAGGSIRIPCSWSGACGMKPTRGVVPFTGAVGMESSLDYIGPITTGVADNALMLEVMADFESGHKRNYTTRLDGVIGDLHVGVVGEGFDNVHSEPDVDECVRNAVKQFEQMNATVEEVSIPEHLTGGAIWGAILFDGTWQTLRLNGLGYNHDGVYSASLHKAMNDWQTRMHELPLNAQLVILMGKYLEKYHGYYYGKAKNLAARLAKAYDKALKKFDLLVMPTTVRKAMKNPASLDEAFTEETISDMFSTAANCAQFNVSGHPVMSIPCGVRNDLPVGLSLIASHFNEKTIYRAAFAFEQATNWQEM